MIETNKTPYMLDFKVPYVQAHDIKKNLHVFGKIKGPIIVDTTHDPYYLKHVILECEQAGLHDAIYLTSNFDDRNYKNTIFFPYFFYRSNLLYNNIKTNIQSKKNNLISCLNRKPASHRLYTIYKILNSQLKHKIMFSAHGLECPYSKKMFDLDKDFSDLPQHVIDYLKKQNLQIPAFQGDNGNDFNNPGNPGDHTWLHPAFSDTYLNIITETTHSRSFLSEKSFKPLAAGQLFLIVGGSETNEAFKFLGFETFDNPFNFHNYLNYKHFIDRIDKMFDLLENIDIVEQLYFENIHALEYNQTLALSDNFRQKCRDLFKPYDILC